MCKGVGRFDEEGVGGSRNAVEAGGGRGRMSAKLDASSGLVLRGCLCVAYQCSRFFERLKYMREAVFWQVKIDGCPGCPSLAIVQMTT